MKKVIKKFLPPIVLDLFKKSKKFGFFGNFQSWPEAFQNSSGYDTPVILEKVKNSLLQVKSGQAIYERDSVLFDKIQYSWPVLTALLWISSKTSGSLNLIDFGGSLGSSYFQNIGFLNHLKDLRWNVVEQEDFIKYGKKYFEDEHLKFYEKIEDCLKDQNPSTILISGTIQYLEKPYYFLELIMSSNFEYIIFDRTTFLENEDRLTLQKVRPGIYEASYPAWFLNHSRFLEILSKKYRLVADFDSLADKIDLGDKIAFEKGFIFRLK